MDFILSFLNEPAILLALVTMVGYGALRRPVHQILAGGLKTAIGFQILQVGATALVTTFRPLLIAMGERFGIQGIILDPYSGLPAASRALEESVTVNGEPVNALSWVGYVMVVGFAINVALVLAKRWTKIETIFLTGHIMFLQSAMATWFMYYFFGFGAAGTIALAGCFMGLYWSLGSQLTLKPTEAVTDGAGFAIGHQQMFGTWLAYKIAPKLGDPERSIENINYPGWLSIFHDNVVASGVIMLAFFGTIMAVMGPEAVGAIDSIPGNHWLTKMFLTSLAFPVGVTIILLGVKMFVAELTASFEGVKERLIPGAAIAVDCAAVFGFASQAVLFGFLFGALGQLIGTATLVIFHSPILAIPGFVPMFFDNATIGVFANKFGGVRAAVILCLCSGMIQVFGGTCAAHLSGLAYGENTSFPGWGGSFDLGTFWLGAMAILRTIAQLLGLGG
jgi:PTS system ascorbate-specific IIC component